MNEQEIQKSKVITAPNGAHGYAITHEWGDVTATGSNSGSNHAFTWTPDSIGVHKLQWYSDYPFNEASIPTATKVGVPVFYQVYTPLVNISQLIDEHDTLSAYEDDLAAAERQIRHVIQNYTGTKFGPYYDKTLEIQGDGGESLYLPTRLVSLTSVINSYGDDITTMVEICPNEPTILQRTNRFRGSHYYEIKRDVFWNSYELFNERYNFTINGDWGYEYVPQEVTEAASLLLEDMFGGTELAELRTQGVSRIQLGDFEIWANADMWGTTGNAKADNLLAPFVSMGIGLV